MLKFWGLIGLYLVTNGVIFLEEETLIVICGIIWIDAAGGMIKELIWSELENRGNVIKEKFVWYLDAKKRRMEVLIDNHRSRGKLVEELEEVYESKKESVVKKTISRSIYEWYLISYYEWGVGIVEVLTRNWEQERIAKKIKPLLVSLKKAE